MKIKIFIAVAPFLPGRAKDLSAPLYVYNVSDSFYLAHILVRALKLLLTSSFALLQRFCWNTRESELSGTLVHFWQVFLSDKKTNFIFLTNVCIQSMIRMAYTHNGITDGHAQNINAEVHAHRRACFSLCKIMVGNASRDINWKCSTSFRKVIHYEILQKSNSLFWNCYIQKTIGRIGE